MKVLIVTAAGPDKWLLNGLRRELAPIKGESVLGRIVRLFGSVDKTHIVTRSGQIINAFPDLTVVPVGEIPYSSSTRLAVADLWADASRVYFVPGDVIFAKSDTELILQNTDPIHWFGNGVEILATTFNKSKIAEMHALLEWSVEQIENVKNSSAWHCNMWTIWRKYHNLPPHKHVWEPRPNFTHLKGGTNDIDKEQDYYKVLERFEHIE